MPQQSSVKAITDAHVRALIALIRKAVTTGQHSQVKTGARDALDELEARLFPGDQGESQAEEIEPDGTSEDGWIETALNGVSVELENGVAVRVSQPADSERSTKDLNDFLRSRYGVELADSAHGWSQASGEPDVTARLVKAR